MDIISIIEKKKLGQVLTKEEIDFFVAGAADGSIPDYQLAALLMAIRLNGMTREETTQITLAMTASGDVCDLSSLNGGAMGIAATDISEDPGDASAAVCGKGSAREGGKAYGICPAGDL